METLIVDTINSNLDYLDKTVTWLVITLIAALLSLSNKDKTVHLKELTLSLRHSGTFLFLMLCAINLSVLKILNSMYELISNSKQNIELIKYTIHNHPSLFNPFSQSTGMVGIIISSIGYSALLLIWWFGYHVGYFLILNSGNGSTIVSRLLSFVYLVLGLISMIYISYTLVIVSPETYLLKLILVLISIVVGSFGIGRIVASINNDA